jgi:hypothetical protein
VRRVPDAVVGAERRVQRAIPELAEPPPDRLERAVRHEHVDVPRDAEVRLAEEAVRERRALDEHVRDAERCEDVTVEPQVHVGDLEVPQHPAARAGGERAHDVRRDELVGVRAEVAVHERQHEQSVDAVDERRPIRDLSATLAQARDALRGRGAVGVGGDVLTGAEERERGVRMERHRATIRTSRVTSVPTMPRTWTTSPPGVTTGTGVAAPCAPEARRGGAGPHRRARRRRCASRRAPRRDRQLVTDAFACRHHRAGRRGCRRGAARRRPCRREATSTQPLEALGTSR